MVELSWCFRAFRRERTTRFILIAIWLGERDLVRSSGSCRLSPRGKGELNWQLDCELLQQKAKAISNGKEVFVRLSAAVPIKVGAGIVRRAESCFVPVRTDNLAMLLKDASAFRHAFPSSTPNEPFCFSSPEYPGSAIGP